MAKEDALQAQHNFGVAATRLSATIASQETLAKISVDEAKILYESRLRSASLLAEYYGQVAAELKAILERIR